MAGEDKDKAEKAENTSVAPTKTYDEDDDQFVPGKQVSLKEQLELDKEDESLRKWKEQLLGNLTLEEGKVDPEVEFKAMRLLVEGRDPLDIPLSSILRKEGGDQGTKKQAALHFVLKETSAYKMHFEFLVKNELVLGLTYLNRVYRLGLQVDKTKIMMGTYGPQPDLYSFDTEEETTPDGMLARGKYSAKTQFVDDDGRSYLEFDYTFEIKREWE